MIERCADDTDRASQLQEQANEQAILNSRRAEQRRIEKVRLAQVDGEFDGEHCVECDDVIPAERLLDHHMHCTPCAQQIENQNKRMGK